MLLLFSLVLFLLLFEFFNGFLDAEMDTIKFNPSASWFPLSVFWVRSNYSKNLFIDCWSIKNSFLLHLLDFPFVWFLLKTVFSFLLDGWHLVKYIKESFNSLKVTFLFLFIAVLFNHFNPFWFFLFPLLFVFRGLVWELTYGNNKI